MNKQKIGFIGPGKMAKAIVNGMITSSFTDSKNLYIYGPTPEKVAHFAELGCTGCQNLQKMCAECAIIFLCIKPQNFPEVLKKLQPLVSDKILFVSIAAGLTAEKICETAGVSMRIVRAMPNTPLLIGRGATAVSSGTNVRPDELQLVCDIFASCGTVRVIPESQLDAIINVNGSTPAYIYLFAETIVSFAKAQGIDPEVAQALFCKTLIGSAYMMLESGLSERALMAMVASKGGTTQAALDELDGSLQPLLNSAMQACLDRAKELGKA